MASTVLPNGIIVPEKFSRDWYADLYHNWQELDNLLGGGTPKDGTLTIQKNGTTVGTFSANQATDETINIEVPTKTSDLNNDSGFITGVSWNDVSDKPTFAAVATSGSYDDLSNKPTIPTVNNAALTIQQNGTTVDTFTANSSSDKTVNIQCVDLTNNQTIGGEKTFSNLRTYFGRDISCYSTRKYGKNLNPTSNTYQYLNFSGNTVSEGPTNDWSSGYLEQVVDTNGGSRGRWFIQDTSENSVGLELWASGNDKQVRPYQNNSTDLGTSTKKWKSFNGLNPGALSLPGNYVNVDTTNWVLDGSTVNVFTPTSDGWLGIQATDTVYDQMHYIFVGRTGGGSTYYQQNLASPINALWDSKYHGSVFIPVVKNFNYDIRCICGSIVATFYPCQGNV